MEVFHYHSYAYFLYRTMTNWKSSVNPTLITDAKLRTTSSLQNVPTSQYSTGFYRREREREKTVSGHYIYERAKG